MFDQIFQGLQSAAGRTRPGGVWSNPHDLFIPEHESPKLRRTSCAGRLLKWLVANKQLFLTLAVSRPSSQQPRAE